MGGCLKWALYSYKRPISPSMAQTVMISLPCKFGKTKLSMVVTFPPLPVLFFKSKQKISTRAKTNKKCKSCCIFIKKYYEEKRGLSEIQAEVRDDGKKEAGMYSWQIWSKDDSRHVQSTVTRAACHVPHSTCCVKRISCHVAWVTFLVTRTTCHVPQFMCHVPCARVSTHLVSPSKAPFSMWVILLS